MELIFLIGSIVLLLLFLFNKDAAASNQANQYGGAYFPGGHMPYQPGRKAGQEKEGPFTAMAYAILFVLTLFAVMQMSHENSAQNSKDRYDKAVDYENEKSNDDSDVVVIRP
jgi:uncharacterized membrane protein